MPRPPAPGPTNTQDPATRDDLRRMRVWLEQLARDVDELQAGGGGGPGTVTEVTSADLSVTVTNGTGPVVDLSVPASSPTFGTPGTIQPDDTADAGSGTDAARANHRHAIAANIAGASTPGDTAAEGAATSFSRSDHRHSLPAFGTTAGTFAEGNDSRFNQLTNDSASNFWARPAAAHASDEEFDATTLPTAMKLYDLSTVPATLVSPINSGISVFDATGPAAGACRIESHMTGKRSWVCMQPRAENRFWFYGKQIVLPAASSGFVTKSRFHIPTRWLGPSVDNTAHMMFTIMTDDGSNRPLSSASAATKVDTGIQAGWEVDVTAANLKVFLKTGGVTSGLVSSGVSYVNAATADFEVSFVKTPAADTAWHVFIHTPSISSFVTTAAYTFVAHAATVWVGWVFNGANNDAPGAPIVRGDYLRFLNTASGFVL